MLDTDTFKSYVRLYKDKQNFEEKLKNIKKQLLEKEQFLIENLTDNEMSKISIAGKTIYTKINVYAVIKNRADAISVLKNTGYEDFVKEGINSQSVSKLVRDLIEENGALPDGFGDVITKGSSMKLGITNS